MIYFIQVKKMISFKIKLSNKNHKMNRLKMKKKKKTIRILYFTMYGY